MSLSLFALGDAAICQAAPVDEGKAKTPPKRQAVARRDADVVPEPR